MRERHRALFLNLCFLTVLESSVDEVWWSGAESLI